MSKYKPLYHREDLLESYSELLLACHYMHTLNNVSDNAWTTAHTAAALWILQIIGNNEAWCKKHFPDEATILFGHEADWSKNSLATSLGTETRLTAAHMLLHEWQINDKVQFYKKLYDRIFVPLQEKLLSVYAHEAIPMPVFSSFSLDYNPLFFPTLQHRKLPDHASPALRELFDVIQISRYLTQLHTNPESFTFLEASFSVVLQQILGNHLRRWGASVVIQVENYNNWKRTEEVVFSCILKRNECAHAYQVEALYALARTENLDTLEAWANKKAQEEDPELTKLFLEAAPVTLIPTKEKGKHKEHMPKASAPKKHTVKKSHSQPKPSLSKGKKKSAQISFEQMMEEASLINAKIAQEYTIRAECFTMLVQLIYPEDPLSIEKKEALTAQILQLLEKDFDLNQPIIFRSASIVKQSKAVPLKLKVVKSAKDIEKTYQRSFKDMVMSDDLQVLPYYHTLPHYFEVSPGGEERCVILPKLLPYTTLFEFILCQKPLDKRLLEALIRSGANPHLLVQTQTNGRRFIPLLHKHLYDDALEQFLYYMQKWETFLDADSHKKRHSTTIHFWKNTASQWHHSSPREQGLLLVEMRQYLLLTLSEIKEIIECFEDPLKGWQVAQENYINLYLPRVRSRVTEEIHNEYYAFVDRTCLIFDVCNQENMLNIYADGERHNKGYILPIIATCFPPLFHRMLSLPYWHYPANAIQNEFFINDTLITIVMPMLAHMFLCVAEHPTGSLFREGAKESIRSCIKDCIERYSLARTESFISQAQKAMHQAKPHFISALLKSYQLEEDLIAPETDEEYENCKVTLWNNFLNEMNELCLSAKEEHKNAASPTSSPTLTKVENISIKEGVTTLTSSASLGF